MAKTFEELIIWKQSRELANDIFALTGKACFRKYRALADQMQRAAVSVMANIAEGYERGSQAEFARFLYISKSSCGELRSHLVISNDLRLTDGKEHRELSSKAFGLSAMISKMISSIRSPR